jgi:protein TonB
VKKKATPRQVKSPSNTVEPPNQIRPQTKFGEESTSKDASVKESDTQANEGNTSAAAGLIMARPLYRKNSAPNYPLRARKKGYEGNVILEVLVDGRGKVTALKLFKSSGYKILDESAMTAIRQWLFEPGTRDGKATKMWVRIPVRFRLN